MRTAPLSCSHFLSVMRGVCAWVGRKLAGSEVLTSVHLTSVQTRSISYSVSRERDAPSCKALEAWRLFASGVVSGMLFASGVVSGMVPQPSSASPQGQ